MEERIEDRLKRFVLYATVGCALAALLYGFAVRYAHIVMPRLAYIEPVQMPDYYYHLPKQNRAR